MTNKVIHIFGASGAGTSTLGKYICDNLGYFIMDTDDYFGNKQIPHMLIREKLRKESN